MIHLLDSFRLSLFISFYCWPIAFLLDGYSPPPDAFPYRTWWDLRLLHTTPIFSVLKPRSIRHTNQESYLWKSCEYHKMETGRKCHMHTFLLAVDFFTHKGFHGSEDFALCRELQSEVRYGWRRYTTLRICLPLSRSNFIYVTSWYVLSVCSLSVYFFIVE